MYKSQFTELAELVSLLPSRLSEYFCCDCSVCSECNENVM